MTLTLEALAVELDKFAIVLRSPGMAHAVARMGEPGTLSNLLDDPRRRRRIQDAKDADYRQMRRRLDGLAGR